MVKLVGHLPIVLRQLLNSIKAQISILKPIDKSSYMKALFDKCRINELNLESLKSNTSFPMTYHRAMAEIQTIMPKDAVLVSEGANTMDIARIIFSMNEPRCRLDAGTFGTMGVGMGFSLAGLPIETVQMLTI